MILARLLPGVCLLGFLMPSSAPAQTTLLVDVDHRPALSLDGDWHYIVDQYGRGLYQLDGKTIRDDGYARNRHPVLVGPRSGFDEYDFASAPTLKVPGDWNTQDPTIFRYEGVVWYERDFDFQPTPGKRQFLHVGAANYRSHVWVNEKRICDHEGGYTPFDCEATAVLKPGTNTVVIAVDATRLMDAIPSPVMDWFNYGGLTRDVSLVEVPKAFIDDFDLHLKRGSSNQIEGYVHVEGATEGSPITLRVPEAGIAVTVKTDSAGRAAFGASANTLQLWSPDTPKLYKVELEAGPDKLADDIGFRDIRVDGTKIVLNGKPIFLRGVNTHAEAPVRTGRVSTDADVAGIFASLQDLHANFVRLAHYPHDERMERMADKLGILIWSEIPVWQSVAFSNQGTYDRAQAMLEEMVRRDRDKASVILWSIGNETPVNPTRTAFMEKLAARTRELDPTRLVTAALNPSTPGNTVIVNDPLMAALDVVGINEYIGWYSRTPEEADSVEWKLPEKPFIISEMGAEGKQGDRGDDHTRWTEESQLLVFKHNFAMLAKIPQVRGYAPWILGDFRSPGRNIPKLQDGFNRKGLISEDGKKKLSFYFLQQIYKDKSPGKPD